MAGTSAGHKQPREHTTVNATTRRRAFKFLILMVLFLTLA